MCPALCGSSLGYWLCRFFFLMIRRPPRSTLFPTRRSSDLSDLRPQWFVVGLEHYPLGAAEQTLLDRKSTRLNSSHLRISCAVFCLRKRTDEHRLRNARLTLSIFRYIPRHLPSTGRMTYFFFLRKGEPRGSTLFPYRRVFH